MREIIPAVMPHDMNAFREQALLVSQFSSIVQVDIMDGHFVPGVTWPYDKDDPMDLDEFPVPSLVWEVHLMIDEPGPLGEAFARIGAERVIGHIEAFSEGEGAAREALNAWRASGVRQAGISLLLDTPLSVVDPLIADNSADFVQVMSIAEIGVQGSGFENRAVERVAELHKKYPDLIISVDGGVSADNARALFNAGATRLAMGSAMWKTGSSEDAHELITTLLKEDEEV